MKTILSFSLVLIMSLGLARCVSSPIVENDCDKSIYAACKQILGGYDESCVREKMSQHIREEMEKDPNPFYDRAMVENLSSR